LTEEEFRQLREGDIVRGKSRGEGYIVQANYSSCGVVITRTQLIRHAPEWDLISKAERRNAFGELVES
jgi:hypothetical protein